MYTKIIKTGHLLEVFSYEKHPYPKRIRARQSVRAPNRKRYRRNVSRARTSFIRLVTANLSPKTPPAFLTLTMREVVEVREGWRIFNKFTSKLRRIFGNRLAYCAVPEFQKDTDFWGKVKVKGGALHFHLLVWGLTDSEISSERASRRFARLWSHGFVDLRPSDGSPRLSGYLAKYMVKAMYDDRLSGVKAYSSSRSLKRPISYNSPEAVSLILSELDGDLIQPNGDVFKGVDIPLLPVKTSEYDTQWLGRCIYKQFNLP